VRRCAPPRNLLSSIQNHPARNSISLQKSMALRSDLSRPVSCGALYGGASGPIKHDLANSFGCAQVRH
jgi:hypothetical protein